MAKKKIIIAVAGASGSIYASRLFKKLETVKEQILEGGIIFSTNAKEIWQHEMNEASPSTLPFQVYDKKNFFAPFASGSANFDTMIICPCSMGLLGRIAAGVSDDLTARAADVILKERKRLILVTRETPLSLIHIENMRTVTLAGGIICPAIPCFYSRPLSLEEMADTVVDRVLDIAGFSIKTSRWPDVGKF